MKKVLYFQLIILLSFSIYSEGYGQVLQVTYLQSREVTIEHEAVVDIDTMLLSISKEESCYYLKNRNSITDKYLTKNNRFYSASQFIYDYYSYSKQKTIATSYDEYRVNFFLTDIYNDFRTKKRLTLAFIPGTNTQACEDKILTPKWGFVADSIKTINGLECHLMKATVYEEEYYAWVCLSIPCSTGPWLLDGTPGLIVKAGNFSEKVRFELLELISMPRQMPTPDIAEYDIVDSKSLNVELQKAYGQFGVALHSNNQSVSYISKTPCRHQRICFP